MYTVRTTQQFDAWMASIKDGTTKRRLQTRLRKALLGNLGDIKPVGSGVMEMREFFGAGWRMYFVQRGSTLIVMLGGGNKSSQSRDISAAKQLAASLED